MNAHAVNRPESERPPATAADGVAGQAIAPTGRRTPTGGTSAPGGSRVLRARVEMELAAMLGEPPAVTLTTSCTHSLEASALLLGVEPGDEVVVPAFTFPSTANAFLLRGATIRFADVDAATGNLDPLSVAQLIGPRTVAVVCVHYGGIACDVDGLLALTRHAGLRLVEDAAHGLMGSWSGTPLGRFGATGCFSFHHTKNLSAGAGGAIVVNDVDLVDRVDDLLDKGTNRVAFDSRTVTAYEWTGVGSAWRMPDAGVEQLAGQLDRREQIQRRRHHVWNRYSTELADWADRVGVQLPHVPPGAQHPAHLFWVLLPPGADRSEFTSWTGERGVPTVRHFGSLPESAFGRSIARADEPCPVAHRFAERLVRLPLHDRLSDTDIDRVVGAVTAWPGRGIR